jgi:uncharacterized membrane protein
MSPWSLAKLYGLTAGVFFAVDVIWIGAVAAGFYREQLGHLLRSEVLWMPALAFYVIYIAGILVFAVLPGLEAASFTRALTLGAFLGFVAYATFDLTAMALLRGFPRTVVVVDMVWGVFLTGSVAAAGYGIGRWLGIGG